MKLGPPHSLTLYDLLKDQGSIIAGVLALIAGILAYSAGRRQADAAERQIRETARQKSMDVVLTTIASNRLLNGILTYTRDRTERAQRLLRVSSEHDARSNLEQLPLHEVSRELGLMPAEIVASYYALAAALAALKRGDIEIEVETVSDGVKGRSIPMPERFDSLLTHVGGLLEKLTDQHGPLAAALEAVTKLP